MQSTNCDPFWGNDPMLLLRVDRFIEFYPSLDMCTNERMNAITRFVIYAGLSCSFIKKDGKYMAIALAIISTLVFLYYPNADKRMVETHLHHRQNNANQVMNQDNSGHVPDFIYTTPKDNGDFARGLIDENMGACKNGNPEQC